MRTIGTLLKDARLEKSFSLGYLEEKTKIKKAFLENLESENWEKLPYYPVVTGFVRTVAKTVGLSEEKAIATLRRDYPPEKIKNINPKPDLSRAFTLSPKILFFVGITFFTFFLLSYLFYQYISFRKPPKLVVSVPSEGQEFQVEKIGVTGQTDVDATITINNQPVLVSGDGSYSTEIEAKKGEVVLEVIATSRSGKKTILRRKIFVKLND